VAHATAALFLFGLAAGFLMVRLRRPGEHRLLRPLGWVTMSAALTLSVLLFALAIAAS